MKRPPVILLGRLLTDPELAYTPTGEAVASFQLTTLGPAATDVSSQRCSAWNQGGRRLADLVLEHLRAGDVVYLEGTLLQPPRASEDDPSRSPSLLVWDLQLLEPSQRASRAVRSHPGVPPAEEEKGE
jgi:single-stranded DNA-binding protein